ncbi:MAG: hypothetical protein WDM86_00440 [Rhizomicrobium sp.]
MANWLGHGWLYKNAQLLFGAQYVQGQIVADPAHKGSFYSQNSWQIGTQFRSRLFTMKDEPDADGAAAADTSFTFKNTLASLEFVYVSNHPSAGHPRNDEMTFTLGAEFEIADKTFLDFGIGEDRKSNGGSTSGFALTQLKYNFASSSSLFSH